MADIIYMEATLKHIAATEPGKAATPPDRVGSSERGVYIVYEDKEVKNETKVPNREIQMDQSPIQPI